MELIRRLEGILEQIRVEFVPDPRLGVFEVSIAQEGPSVAIVGVTSELEAANALHRRLGTIETDARILDSIVHLPIPEMERPHALVSASVAPILSGPLISEPHISQTLLGHRLTALREHGRWLQCRSEDGYIGWVHRGYLHRVDEAEARAWEMGRDGEPCISLGAEIHDGAGELLARLPLGSRVLSDSNGTAVLPDGTSGRLTGELVPVRERATRFPASGEAVVETAARWIGSPYVWGGITPAGVDCSGLVQAVLRLHGISLPRDSDQQARTGEPVDPGLDFERLQVGDLVFFCEIPRQISHVGFSLGGGRILHSSLGNGGVRRNDLNGDLPYEQELRKLFTCARRVI